MYVSFVDPTWSDDQSRNELDRAKFDALDSEHFICIYKRYAPSDAKVDYNSSINQFPVHTETYTTKEKSYNEEQKTAVFIAGLL
jgi:hypothetical protein